MKLLSVDTATEACSAALLIDGVVSERYTIAPRQHSHLILGMVDELLSDAGVAAAELDCLAFGRGPGSFMGIRIAAGVVQGIGFAHDLPVVPVSTLRSIAQVAHDSTGNQRIITAIDARMGEVYWAAWNVAEDSVTQQVAESVCAPTEVIMPEGDGWTGAGTGWQSYAETLQQAAAGKVATVLPDCYPSAASIARIAVAEFEAGNTVQAAAAVPVYLRDKVAAKPNPAKYAGL